MNTELQNRAWASLPDDTKEFLEHYFKIKL